MIYTLIHNGVAIACIESHTKIKVAKIANANIEINCINSTNKKHINSD